MTLEDAIYELLGIPHAEQPADCYRLLGLARFESNPEVIRNAAARQVLFVRQLAKGRFADVSQPLIDQLNDAQARLLSPRRRRQYDEHLGAAEDGTTKRLLLPQAIRRVTTPAVRPARREVAQYARAAERSSCGKQDDSRGRGDAPAHGDGPTSSTPQGEAGPREWVVGVDSDCDLVLRSPYVSRRHCRVWETEGLFWIEDLGSRNGTHLNGRRVEGRQLVREDDCITLGTRTRLPWPPAELPLANAGAPITLITLGRGAANDLTLRDASVSRYHAQLSVLDSEAILEDLGSTNGTFVGESALRIGRQRVRFNESITLGRLRMTVQQVIAQAQAAMGQTTSEPLDASEPG